MWFFVKFKNKIKQTNKQKKNLKIKKKKRKMVTITLYTRQQKRHRCIEQSFGLYGRGRGGMIWENVIETCVIPYKK